MAAYYVVPHDGQQKPERSDAVAVVPFVPWRCPTCGDSKPRTYGQEGRVRYHCCRRCKLNYRSIEIDPKTLRDPNALRGLIP